MGTNAFLPFGTAAGANVMAAADYAALAARSNGFSSGTALSIQLNTVWRQSSFVAAMIGQLIADHGGNANDDGVVVNLENAYLAALSTLFAGINGTASVPFAASQFLAGEGAGAANGYSFTGDSGADTGMYSPSPGVLQFYSNATLELTVSAAGVAAAGALSAATLNVSGNAVANSLSVSDGVSTTNASLPLRVNGYTSSVSLDESAYVQHYVLAGTNPNAAVNVSQLNAVIGTVLIYMSAVGASQSWTVPGGVTRVKVRMWAGGGSGGTTVNANSVGSGGGGGGYNEGFYNVTPGASISITVGVGGVSNGNPGGNGYAGTSSSFGTMASATGGGAGTGANGNIPTTAGAGGTTYGGYAYGVNGTGGGFGLTYGGGSYGGGIGGGAFASSIPQPSVSSGAASGSGGTYPGGGGNGGGVGGAGGAGAPGLVIVEY